MYSNPIHVELTVKMLCYSPADAISLLEPLFGLIHMSSEHNISTKPLDQSNQGSLPAFFISNQMQAFYEAYLGAYITLRICTSIFISLRPPCLFSFLFLMSSVRPRRLLQPRSPISDIQLKTVLAAMVVRSTRKPWKTAKSTFESSPIHVNG